MTPVIIYLIRANISLTLFYLAYRLGLRKLTFLTLNRIFLVAGIIFSALAPFFRYLTIFGRQMRIMRPNGPWIPDWITLQEINTQHAQDIFWTLLGYIFWMGVLVMLVRFLIRLLALLRLHQRSNSQIQEGCRVKILSGKSHPFSFFQHIYLDPQMHAPEELKLILRHEQSHVRGYHSLDIVLAEINLIFYWFNPGAWLMKNAIRENLEFLADRMVLKGEVNKRDYQYQLLKFSLGDQMPNLAHSFNLNFLKSRIMMMNSQRSSNWQMAKYMFLIPVVMTISLAFNDPYVIKSRLVSKKGPSEFLSPFPGFSSWVNGTKSSVLNQPALFASSGWNPVTPSRIPSGTGSSPSGGASSSSNLAGTFHQGKRAFTRSYPAGFASGYDTLTHPLVPEKVAPPPPPSPPPPPPPLPPPPPPPLAPPPPPPQDPSATRG
ncbi:MAG: M56 family metallopeptidase, partial [Chitinophagaceae bacterium]